MKSKPIISSSAVLAIQAFIFLLQGSKFPSIWTIVPSFITVSIWGQWGHLGLDASLHRFLNVSVIVTALLEPASAVPMHFPDPTVLAATKLLLWLFNPPKTEQVVLQDNEANEVWFSTHLPLIIVFSVWGWSSSRSIWHNWEFIRVFFLSYIDFLQFGPLPQD